MILISPTEHALAALGGLTVSAIPERHGCDVLSTSRAGFVGYQRKTLPDLAASILDGRLAKEFGQMLDSGLLAHRFLILEDPFTTTIDGHYLGGLSVATVRSIIAKAQALSIGYLPTTSPPDTLAAIHATSAYLARGHAERLVRPKRSRDSWGQPSSRQWALHLLQSFPGVGPVLAAAIYDAVGLPLRWTLSATDLLAIDGIGPTIAERLLGALPEGSD